MGDIRFSNNDDFNKTFLRPSQFVADRFLRCKSMVFVGVRVYIAICSQRCCRPSTALSQSVRSCRGPIYRARVYVNAHVMEGGNACAVKWIYVFDEMNARVWWCGYVCVIMWIHIFGSADMCICLCQNTGAMNRPLRLAECFVVISWVFIALLTIRSQRNGRLLATVGADLSCPHIGIHP